MTLAWIKPLSAACFLILICLHPADSLEAASAALRTWSESVAPALLPFLIAAPALTDRTVCALLGRFSGGLLRALRLPVHSTGALLIGLLSGSPAGASALSAVPPDSADAPGAYLRAAVLASGASPAFLIASVSVGMLNAPEAGIILLRAQIFSGFAACALLRPFGRARCVASSDMPSSPRPAVLSAALTLLSIAGYMALFSVLARLVSLLLAPSLETPLAAVFELAGGCRALSRIDAPLSLRLPVISAVACFGGLSVYAQSMSFLTRIDVRPAEYAAAKLMQSALAALATHLQLVVRPSLEVDPLQVCLLILLLIAAALLRALQTARLARQSPRV